MGEGIASYPKADTCPSRARFLNRHIKGVKVNRRLEEYIMGNKLDGEHTGTANATCCADVAGPMIKPVP